jgi:hypothetical protein
VIKQGMHECQEPDLEIEKELFDLDTKLMGSVGPIHKE